ANLNGYRWVMKDLPALRAEKYITTLKDYQAKIEFELLMVHIPGKPSEVKTGEWEQVIGELLKEERFGSQLNRKGFFKEDVAAIVAKQSDPAQQMQAIYDLVKNTMKWNGKYGIYTTGTLRKAFESKTGSAAEVNLLLTAMLQEAGLDAAPVLVSTREHGRIHKGTPLLNKFNYVVAHVTIGGKEHLLDATDPLLPAGMLPVRSLNGEGHLIKPKAARWVALKPSGLNQKFYNGNLVVNEHGEIKGEVIELSGGYRGLNLRKEIQEEGEEKYTEKLNREIGDYKISKPTFSYVSDLGKPVELKYHLKAAGGGQVADVIYINPMMGQGEKENPFKLEERDYPVDFAVPINQTFMCRFIIPDNYELEESPKNVKVSLPDNGGSFTYMVDRQDNVIEVMSKIDILKPIYYAQEYPALKELYAQIVAKHAEKIVLKRK
ncbi:hypothetical protein OB13_15300, partial [Pontibacter sp. HJ8]